MSSLLGDLRSDLSTQINDYKQLENECPPIPERLLVYLDRMFARKVISPTSVSMQQELVYQAGIDKVINHLRSMNGKQTAELESTRLKTS